MTTVDDAPDSADADGVAPGAPPSRRARLRARQDHYANRFADLRRRSGLTDALARAWELDTEVGGGIMAGALAFRLFLFMVPFSFLGFLLVGSSASLAASSPTEMAQRAGIGGLLAKGVVNADSISHTNQFFLIVIAGYAMITAARSVVGTIIDAYALIWRMPRVKMKRMKPALLFIAFVALVSMLSSYLGKLRAAAPAPGLTLTLAWLLLPVVAGWWAAAKLPHGDAPVWALFPGAVLFGVGIQAMHLFTVYYVSRSVASKSETYGVIGVALAVLLWAYVSGRFITAIAVVNAALWRRFCQVHPEDVEQATAIGAEHGSRLRSWWDWVRSAAGLLR